MVDPITSTYPITPTNTIEKDVTPHYLLIDLDPTWLVHRGIKLL
jgi:hypothetical protein